MKSSSSKIRLISILCALSLFAVQPGFAATKSVSKLKSAGRTANSIPNTILNGISAPSKTIGINGDFYIDTKNLNIYGPKKKMRGLLQFHCAEQQEPMAKQLQTQQQVLDLPEQLEQLEQQDCLALQVLTVQLVPRVLMVQPDQTVPPVKQVLLVHPEVLVQLDLRGLLVQLERQVKLVQRELRAHQDLQV